MIGNAKKEPKNLKKNLNNYCYLFEFSKVFLTKYLYIIHFGFMTELFMPENSDLIKKEREKAKKLKKTRWWREKIQKGLCYHCGKNFNPKELTMDHLTPLVRGGKTGKNNVVTSCRKCNSQKSFKTLVGIRLKKA